MEYNADKINQAVHARKRMAKTCQKIAAQYAPVPLPESCLAKICTRRKLYNYLEALDMSHASIQAIFWQYDLSVPRDRSLKPSTAMDRDARPAWLDGEPFDACEEWHKQNADTDPVDLNEYLGAWNL